ncbi:hypothetical protein OG21DRAFT_160284 [Imleria badia]|nr:hypothetical protein OG21DRAFT_160284 [Imleria badia]
MCVSSSAKCHPRHFCPMVVVSCTPKGACRLAELNSTVSKLELATFSIIPYHARPSKSVPVTVALV